MRSSLRRFYEKDFIPQDILAPKFRTSFPKTFITKTFLAVTIERLEKNHHHWSTIRDPYDRLIRDPKNFIRDSQVFIVEPKIFIGNPKLSV